MRNSRKTFNRQVIHGRDFFVYSNILPRRSVQDVPDIHLPKTVPYRNLYRSDLGRTNWVLFYSSLGGQTRDKGGSPLMVHHIFDLRQVHMSENGRQGCRPCPRVRELAFGNMGSRLCVFVKVDYT